MVAARARDQREHVRVHPRAGRRRGQRVRLQGAHPVPQPGREHLLQLGQRAHRLVPAPEGAHWSEFPRGRHFPVMEAPAELAADLRAFFGPLD